MPTGERAAWYRGGRHAGRQAVPRRGFTYLLLLFGMAVAGAGLATVGMQWQQAARREREAELLFRGLQMRAALQRFHDQTPAGQPALPQALDELLTDRRGAAPRHHLRQLWPDPFTSEPDWVLLRRADGGIVGLHSRSAQPLLRRAGPPAGVGTPDLGDQAPTTIVRALHWQFVIQPGAGSTRTAP